MTITNSLNRLICVLKCIGYELLPVHPVYAIQTTKEFMKQSKILTKTIYKLILYLIKELYINIQSIKLLIWLYISLWFTIWNIFILYEFGSLWILISAFYLIFSNLGDRKEGELSAYSVFNKNFTQILGTLTADQLDAEIRHGR